MAQVLHGWLQQARLTASNHPYRIKTNHQGSRVWKHLGQGVWIPIAHFTDQDAAEEWVVMKLPVE